MDYLTIVMHHIAHDCVSGKDIKLLLFTQEKVTNIFMISNIRYCSVWFFPSIISILQHTKRQIVVMFHTKALFILSVMYLFISTR